MVCVSGTCEPIRRALLARRALGVLQAQLRIRLEVELAICVTGEQVAGPRVICGAQWALCSGPRGDYFGRRSTKTSALRSLPVALAAHTGILTW